MPVPKGYVEDTTTTPAPPSGYVEDAATSKPPLVSQMSTASGPAAFGDLNASTERQPDAEIARGLVKGAKETGTGIMKVAKGAATGDFGPFDDPAVENEIYDPLKGQTVFENIGKGIEHTAENFIPGAFVERSIGATRGLPTAIRVADAMWKEGVGQAATSFLQTGGDPKAAGEAGAIGGLTRGAMSTPLFLRDAKLAKEVLAEAQRFGIPLTKAEQTQSAIRKLGDFMVAKSVGGARRMAEFRVDRNAMLENVARGIADSVDPNALDPRSMGQYVQNSMDQVRQLASSELRQATEQITSGATGQLPLDLGQLDAATGNYKPSGLVQAARDIITEHKYQELHNLLGSATGGTDNVNDAFGLLSKIANPVETEIVDAVAHALDPSQGIAYKLKQVDVATARELRTLLFDKSAFNETTTGKAAIQKLNGAVHDELISTLDRNGLQQEAKDFEAASGNYKETLRKLETRLMTHLSKKGDFGVQQVPAETIASVLRGSQSESTAVELSKILQPDQMNRVRASLLRQTIEDTQHAQGFWDAQKFKSQIDGLGDKGGAALYGPQLYSELKDFAKAAERYRITPNEMNIAGKTGTFSLPFLAQIRAYGLAAAIPHILSGGITKADLPEIGAVVGETLGMNIAARIMTRPAVVNDLTKAMSVDPMSTVGKQLAARISAYVTTAASEIQQEENRRRAALPAPKLQPSKMLLVDPKTGAGTAPAGPPPLELPEPSNMK